jgi:lipopolysaccharide transport system ATP-binding protein
MTHDTSIVVDDLAKCYHIYRQPMDRLKQALWRGRRRYYSEFWALRDVSFSVDRGETVGIIGRNGSGKSTLLQCICGTLSPTRGGVDVRGRVAALLELGAGFNPEFTGRENVYLNASILGLRTEEIDERFGRIAAFAEIGPAIEQPVKTYSSGMFLRLAFAVIAHVDADVLIIDEALAVGDTYFVQRCMRFLRRFQEHGSILFVSHDMSSVLNLCDRTIWLQDGRMERLGPSKQVVEGYFEHLFGDAQGPAAEPAPEVPGPAEEAIEEDEPPECDAIRIEGFDPEASSFGTGGARIIGATLYDKGGRTRRQWIMGGEEVELVIRARVEAELAVPILGFFVKDRLGQQLFGENTLAAAGRGLPAARPGDTLQARFIFRIPTLAPGNYSICVAAADRVNDENVIHHWYHDAIALTSASSSTSTGLVGIPMQRVDFFVESDA